jgi:hypothetical protein
MQNRNASVQSRHESERMPMRLFLLAYASGLACAGGPDVKDVLVVSVEAWSVLDEQITIAIERRAAAIAEWKRIARCSEDAAIATDCARATQAGHDLKVFSDRWDALSITIDVVLAIWKGVDPKKAVTDAAPEAIDATLASVKGHEAQAIREALAEAKRLAPGIF